MQYFAREVAPSAVQADALHNTIIGPDGDLQLGIPLRRERPSRSSGGASTSAGSACDTFVVMHPGATEQETYWLLATGYAADLIICFVGFLNIAGSALRLHFLRPMFGAGIVLGSVGVLTSVCPLNMWRKGSPRLLHLVAIVSFVQMLVCGLWPQTVAQLLHVAVQPLIVNQALRLRRVRTPQWFSTGRMRGRLWQ